MILAFPNRTIIQIVTAILEERWPRCATRKTANACASQDTAVRDVINASPATTDTRIASRAIAAIPAVLRAFARRTASVRACRTSRAALATSAVRAISNIPNV